MSSQAKESHRQSLIAAEPQRMSVESSALSRNPVLRKGLRASFLRKPRFRSRRHSAKVTLPNSFGNVALWLKCFAGQKVCQGFVAQRQDLVRIDVQGTGKVSCLLECFKGGPALTHSPAETDSPGF